MGLFGHIVDKLEGIIVGTNIYVCTNSEIYRGGEKTFRGWRNDKYLM